MAKLAERLNPAEKASHRALNEVYGCLERKESFIVEAGAGAGKTYTLVKALCFVIKRHERTLRQRHQKIACITFTNVAKDEIDARTDRSLLIYCNTIHAFCWSLIGSFQKQLRELLPKLEQWTNKIAEAGDLGEHSVEYDLGYRTISDRRISIHHDDVLSLTIKLMDYAKFRRILANKYPIILIDEYQDTNVAWIDAIKTHFLGQEGAPQFGLFGDHWQKIYGDGCGKVEHPSLRIVSKRANFRSASVIVDCLNRMRPELPQFPADSNEQGYIRIFHTNPWKGKRKGDSHWKGDLPDEAAEKAFNITRAHLVKDGWDLSLGATKILMLTHRVLASKQGYPSVPTIFRFNSSFTNKEHPHIAFFADTLEPACEAYRSKKYGEMFRVLGSSISTIRTHTDKKAWSAAMDRLNELRDSATVGDVMDHLLAVHRPRVPDAVERSERKLQEFDPEGGKDMPRVLKELSKLRAVKYQEIIALCRYLSYHSPFETQHGVKGAEFENVLVVVGRGWNRYNFNKMLELANAPTNIPSHKQDIFERNRNLFYVSCSRAKKRLSILFTQELSEPAIQTISSWFGKDNVEALNL